MQLSFAGKEILYESEDEGDVAHPFFDDDDDDDDDDNEDEDEDEEDDDDDDHHGDDMVMVILYIAYVSNVFPNNPTFQFGLQVCSCGAAKDLRHFGCLTMAERNRCFGGRIAVSVLKPTEVYEVIGQASHSEDDGFCAILRHH